MWPAIPPNRPGSPPRSANPERARMDSIIWRVRMHDKNLDEKYAFWQFRDRILWSNMKFRLYYVDPCFIVIITAIGLSLCGFAPPKVSCTCFDLSQLLVLGPSGSSQGSSESWNLRWHGMNGHSCLHSTKTVFKWEWTCVFGSTL